MSTYAGMLAQSVSSTSSSVMNSRPTSASMRGSSIATTTALADRFHVQEWSDAPLSPDAPLRRSSLSKSVGQSTRDMSNVMHKVMHKVDDIAHLKVKVRYPNPKWILYLNDMTWREEDGGGNVIEEAAEGRVSRLTAIIKGALVRNARANAWSGHRRMQPSAPAEVWVAYQYAGPSDSDCAHLLCTCLRAKDGA
jgi:hypothetical protein